MFPRQWHSPNSQLGLTSSFLDFEYSLRSKHFAAAQSILFDNVTLDRSYIFRQFKRLRFIEKFCASPSNHLSYSFVDFWPDHDPTSSQLSDFIQYSLPDLTFSYLSDYTRADILFCSCYGNTDLSSLSKHSTRILFLGENVRPQYYFYDYSLSFDIDTYCLRNIYFPLWLLEIDWFNKTVYPDRRPLPLSRFTSPLIYDPITRSESLVYIGNNNEPYRTSTMYYLQQNGINLEKYGSHTRPVGNKEELLSQYKATIAFENSFSPGYITEKPIHGLLSSTPTLYWGGHLPAYSPFLDHPLLYHCSPADNMHKILDALQAYYHMPRTVFPPIFSHGFATSTFYSLVSRIRELFSIYYNT